MSLFVAHEITAHALCRFTATNKLTHSSININWLGTRTRRSVQNGANLRLTSTDLRLLFPKKHVVEMVLLVLPVFKATSIASVDIIGSIVHTNNTVGVLPFATPPNKFGQLKVLWLIWNEFRRSSLVFQCGYCGVVANVQRRVLRCCSAAREQGQCYRSSTHTFIRAARGGERYSQ